MLLFFGFILDVVKMFCIVGGILDSMMNIVMFKIILDKLCIYFYIC